MNKFFFTLMLVSITMQGISGGYQVGLHGQKQTGMGLIGTSFNMDASAGFYNPGGLALMPQNISILAGVSGIISTTTFQLQQPSLYQTTTDNPLSTPFYFYAAGRINDRLAAGIAVNTPFGSSVNWGENWAGRYLIQDINMSTITIQPTLSFAITETLSIGGGFVFATGDVDMRRALPLQGPEEEAGLRINGSTTGFGFNTGILFASHNGLNIGVSYRSKIDMELDDATATFTVPASLQPIFPDGNAVGVTLPLPANLDFGISFQVNRQLILGMALNYVFWSAYDTLAFNFAINTPVIADSQNPREYSDRLIVRIGGEYMVHQYFFVRAGAYFDPSPVNNNYFSPETPSLDNLALTTGVSYAPTFNLSIDLSFLYIMGREQEVNYSPENFGGTYRSKAFIPGIGISYSL